MVDDPGVEGIRRQAIENFREHVSSAKVQFFQQYNMDLVMGRREGPWIWDVDGTKRVFNLHCNGGVFNLGHRNQEIIDVLNTGVQELDIGNGHLISKARADLACLLADLMPGDLNYTVFGVSGGEAIDLAIKVARGYTRRSKIISAHGGYHGHTGLAMAAGDEKYRDRFGPQPSGFVQIPFNQFDPIEQEVDNNTAAVLLETVPATLGMVVPSDGYLNRVRDICDQRGALLILDEVQTGLGRTGKLWGFEHFDVIPDIVVLAKGLSGGIYPITATVIRKPLESVFHADPFIHVSTFGGSELGCRVAQRVVEISSAREFLDHVNTLAERFAARIDELKKKHEVLVKLRQLGLFMGLELANQMAGPLLSFAAYQNDLLMVYANNDPSVCQFLPPLVMELDQVDWVIDRLDKALSNVEAMLAGLNP